MMKENDTEQFSDEETKRRFEAALRGARAVGHEFMKDIGKHKAKTGTKASPGVVSGADKSKRGSK